MVEAVKQNFPQREIADAAFELQREYDSRRRGSSSASTTTSTPATSDIPTLRIDPELERKQRGRLQAVRARRDGRRRSRPRSPPCARRGARGHEPHAGAAGLRARPRHRGRDHRALQDVFGTYTRRRSSEPTQIRRRIVMRTRRNRRPRRRGGRQGPARRRAGRKRPRRARGRRQRHPLARDQDSKTPREKDGGPPPLLRPRREQAGPVHCRRPASPCPRHAGRRSRAKPAGRGRARPHMIRAPAGTYDRACTRARRSASSWPSLASTGTTAGRRSSPARCATPAWRSSTRACTRRRSRSSRP